MTIMGFLSTLVSELQAHPTIFTLLEATVKGSIILMLIGGLAFALRKASAAIRHMMWGIGLISLLVLPVFLVTLPSWEALPELETAPASQPIVAQTSAPLEGVVTTEAPNQVAEAPLGAPIAPIAPPALLYPGEESSTGAAQSITPVPGAVTPTSSTSFWTGLAFSWTTWVFIIWLVGVVVVLGRLLVGIMGVWWIARQTTHVTDERAWTFLLNAMDRMQLRCTVRLLESDRFNPPVTWGIFRPVILLPSDYQTWPDEKLKMVLMHELAHIQRWDYIVQLGARLACAVYWFNPLVWRATRHLLAEQEAACDDYVIRRGTQANAYAKHLLDIARALRTSSWASPSVISMARRSQLEGRLLNVLNTKRNREEINLMKTARYVAIALAVVLPLSALQFAQAQKKPVIAETEARTPEADLLVAETLVAEKQTLTPLHEAIAEILGKEGAAEALQGLNLPFDEDPDPDLASDTNPNPEVDPIVDPDPDYNFDFNPDYDDEDWDQDQDEDSDEDSDEDPDEDYEAHEEDHDVAHDDLWDEVAQAVKDELADLNITGFDLTGEDIVGQINLNCKDCDSAEAEGQLAGYMDLSAALTDTTLSIDDLIRLRRYGVTPEYIREMRAVGYGDLSLEEVVQMARYGVTSRYLRELRDQGYTNLSYDDVTQMARYGVSGELAQAIRATFPDISASDITQASRYGVDGRYIREVSTLGYDLSLDDIIRMSRYGLTVDMARNMKQAYPAATLDDLIRASRYGIDTNFIADMRSVGYTNMDLDQLIQMSRYGVSKRLAESLKVTFPNITADEVIQASRYGVNANYVRDLATVGFKNLSVDDVTQMSRYGVNARYVRDLDEAGFENLTTDDVVRMSRYGVSAGLVKEVRTVFPSITTDAIISFARYGVDASYIKAIRESGLKDLTVDDLIKLRRAGVDAKYIREMKKIGDQ